MATKGSDTEEKHEPLTDVEEPKPEIALPPGTERMFEAIGVKPKTADPRLIQDWMMAYLQKAGRLTPPGEPPVDKGVDKVGERLPDVEEDTDSPQPAPEPSVDGPDTPLSRPTSSVNMITQHPRISTFSGETSKATDTSYEVWKYEVSCLKDDSTYPPHVVSQAIRRSLKGEAAKVAMRLGSSATTDQLIAKLDSVYGVVETKESMLAQFYSARQREDEDVSAWSCRLEDTLNKATVVDPEGMGMYNRDEMLRTMLWTGLRPSLKDRSGHKFDSIGEFDVLRSALRRVEFDQKQRAPTGNSNQKTGTSKMAIGVGLESNNLEDEFHELKGLVHQMSADITAMKDSRGGKQRTKDKKPAPHAQVKQTQRTQQDKAASHHEEPTCYRCGQQGHLQIGCRVILDHSKKGNSKGSMA